MEMMKDILKKIRKKSHDDLIRYEIGSIKNDATILSYINNQYLLSSGISYESDEEYQYIRTVHKILRLYTGDDLNMRRVGNTYDGGYVMACPFSDNKVAFSLGIWKDVSWDLEIADAGYDVYQYDHTIKRLPKKHSRFHWEKKGISGSNHGDFISIRQMLQNSGHGDESGFLLKMDIEGSEWDALETVDISDISRFDQIVIELHNLLDIANRGRILKCLEKLTKDHAVIHIHANNFERVCYKGDIMLPTTLELTLVRKDRYKLVVSNELLPGRHDAPNNTALPDIAFGKWNLDI